MSHPQRLYIGPYAEWFVRPEQEPEDSDTLTGGALRNTPLDGFESEVGGVKVYQRCYFPGADRPNQPSRTMYLPEPWIGAEESENIDPQEEMKWFAKAFRKELESLAAWYGEPPTLRWGLVGWIR